VRLAAILSVKRSVTAIAAPVIRSHAITAAIAC
jgi:hypothetical protein